MSACSNVDTDKVDRLNAKAYFYHFKNIDSTYAYAKKALALSHGYDAGAAEALNNLAFVDIVKMDYPGAAKKLNKILSITNNQVELMIADVQLMRLCQRKSNNKEFYDYYELALRHQRRIHEEEERLSEHQAKRLLYAKSEFSIVTSVYYYYVGLGESSHKAIESINPEVLLQGDTAQYLSYLYNVGAGGIPIKEHQDDVYQQEFDYLARCYIMARQLHYDYWEANSLQALSEHLITPQSRVKLIKDNLPTIKYINVDEMPDSLLAGNLAQRATDLFRSYGDVYQIASSYRTLASCYWQIADYNSAIACLENTLAENKSIQQAPDLIASIREQLSVFYSAVNDKHSSDYNRNIYLDLQERTRQDRYLESHAGQLEATSRQLNIMIVEVVLMIAFVLCLLLFFHYLRRRKSNENSLEKLLQPLEEWRERNANDLQLMEEKCEEIQEEYYISKANVSKNKKRNIEKRAKLFLVSTITPFIDRMLHEITRLKSTTEAAQLRDERYLYISELTSKINDYNDVLTQWIQLHQGALSMYIESFPLQNIFDVVIKSKTSFLLKEIELDIKPTSAVVKADKVLTLFMLNTLADNARKFTDAGGKVTIVAKEEPNYVEISVEDTGKGIAEADLAHVFDHKAIVDYKNSESHGFGLMNCQGIINKYKKTSNLFSVCCLKAESQVGKGSRFFFRLPKGITRILILLFVICNGFITVANAKSSTLPRSATQATNHRLQYLDLANIYADSAYYSNIKGNYEKTLSFADTCRYYLNQYYLQLRPNGRYLMKRTGELTAIPAELQWLHDNFPTNYSIILDIRNESAVAALALHDWELYKYNNNVYTLLFKENSADKTLGEYCRMMQRSESNKSVAVILLIVLLLSIFPLYYFMYYRHRFYFQFYMERVKQMNEILLSSDAPTIKKTAINEILSDKFPEELKDIATKIQQALQQSIESRELSKTNIELAEDELRKMDFEDNKLHISNNILDNCLSTLKHETMYYPSRISQLVSGKDQELQSIDELATYYKELYTILSMQATRHLSSIKPICQPVSVKNILSRHIQTETPEMANYTILGDEDLLIYLFEIIHKLSGNENSLIHIEPIANEYLLFKIPMPSLRLTDEECLMLFSPSVEHIPYLICRQIVRENADATNHHRCGVTAISNDGKVHIEIILTRTK